MLKEALIASKLLGSGGGGGGDCELTLATMNLTNTEIGGTIGVMGCIIDRGRTSYSTIAPDGETAVQVILYHGVGYVDLDAEELISMSGDVQGYLEDGFEITGDCAITCKGWGSM